MYAKIENNQVVEYPLFESQVKERFPNTSFPSDFAAWVPDGYVRVAPGSNPGDNEYQLSVEGTPQEVDGQWVQVFTLQDRFTAEELAAYEAAKTQKQWDVMRDKRDGLIKLCNWIVERHREQVELEIATTITQGQYMAWLSYRQVLRDFPATITDINSVRFPTPPGEFGE